VIQVSITKGNYRGQPVSGMFTLVKPYVDGARGGYITIRNPEPKLGHPPVQRVAVEQGDFKMVDASGNEVSKDVVVDEQGKVAVKSVSFEQELADLETEDEAMERIAETFLMLNRITDACSKGNVRGLVVSGPPGIGKSFEVEKQLEAANMFRKLQGREPKYEIVSGGVSSIGLYQKLYHNRTNEHVLVFDDCDGVLFEEEAITLLKAALNSGDRRRICWNKESRTLKTEDIPEAFDFNASIIFLSNVDFEASIARESRIAAHLAAIMSRCHYMDLEIGSLRDQLLRIKQVMRDGMLTAYQFTQEQEKDILDYVFSNPEYLREVSLRMVKKIADFVKSDPTDWKEMVEATCLHREAKFKRLLAKRAEAKKRGVEIRAV
jgi:hypothetical protein